MSEVISAGGLLLDYMKLLTTQLKNQNPLDPMDNNDMTAQMTQFSQLAQLETMNSSFADVLKTVERDQAIALLGKNVSFIGETSDGSVNLITGKVEQIANKDGEVLLGVGDYTLTLNDIIGVSNVSDTAVTP